MCTHLHKRGNTYYFRRAVPHDLITVYGRSEIQRTLSTRDRAEAVIRCRRMSVRYDVEFSSVRAGRPPEIPYIDCYNVKDDSVAPEATPRTTAPSEAVVDTPKPAEPAAPTATATPSANPKGISLDKLADKWEAERKPDWKSIAATRRVIKSFHALVGEGKLMAPEIKRGHAIQFKDKLLESGQTGVNTNKYLTVFNVLLNYGVANGHLEVNPARGVKVVVKRKAKDARHPFDLPALRAIFSRGAYGNEEIPDHIGYEAAYWIPLLALFYGARREELCQLRPEDVYEESYVDADGTDAKTWVLRITDNEDEGQGVKTVDSARRVPLHSELIARGFLEFVMKKRGKSRLFDQLKPDEHGIEGTAFGKWFNGSLRTEWGVTNKKMVFHSFRHNFKDYCRALEISEEVSDALSGHSNPKVSRQYGGLSYPLRPLVEAVRRYKVPGLKLP